MEANQQGVRVAIFFCRQLDPDQDTTRRLLEKELGPRIRFFPLPCSGRIDPLHFLKALETGSDKVYLIACPEGACRYGQGNVRARKRLSYARGLIEEIGFAPESFELIYAAGPLPVSIDTLSRQLLGLGPARSPAVRQAPGSPAIPEKKGETVAVKHE